MDCITCGNKRPDRGTCKACGSRLCCVCRLPLPLGRRDRRCRGCKNTSSKADYAKNPEVRKASSRAWASANSDRKKDTDRNWKSENPGKQSAYSQKWRDGNPEQRREIVRRWVENNPDKVKSKDHRRRARKMGCTVTAADLNEVVSAAEGKCCLCREPVPEKLQEIDHIVPLAKGGPHSFENLQLLCRTCNRRKGSLLFETPDRG